MNAMPTAATRSTREASARQKAGQQIDSIVEVITPENISFNYQAAGPFRRLPAWIIDMLLLFAALLLLYFLGGLFVSLFASVSGGLREAFGAVALFSFVMSVFVFVSYWFYGAFFETYCNGRTPGKMIMGIRVLTSEGTPINGMQATLRHLFRVADLMPLLPLAALDPYAPQVTIIPTCLLGLVVMALNRRYQRIGDLVAGTMVVVEERSWLMGMAQLEDSRTSQLAAVLPPKFRVSRDLAKALAAYVERRQYFSQARRREIARHLGEPLIRVFELPADTSHDLLLCALYYRTFIADRGDAQTPVPPPQHRSQMEPDIAEGVYFDPLGSPSPAPMQMPVIHIRE